MLSAFPDRPCLGLGSVYVMRAERGVFDFVQLWVLPGRRSLHRLLTKIFHISHFDCWPEECVNTYEYLENLRNKTKEGPGRAGRAGRARKGRKGQGIENNKTLDGPKSGPKPRTLNVMSK